MYYTVWDMCTVIGNEKILKRQNKPQEKSILKKSKSDTINEIKSNIDDSIITFLKRITILFINYLTY